MKDWTGGRASVFKTNGANGLEEREENDFYATDPSCAKDIIDILGAESFSENHVIWECACGQGHLAKEFEKLTKATVLSTDLIDRGFGQSGVDFLLSSRPKVANGGGYDNFNKPAVQIRAGFCRTRPYAVKRRGTVRFLFETYLSRRTEKANVV